MAHPLSGADLTTFNRVLAEAGGEVDRGKARAIKASILGRSPLTAIEKRRADRVLPSLDDMPSPTFILGHWRSGTTHLYNIMSHGEFTYVPPVAVGLPWDMLYLGRALRPVLERALPKGRYIDNIPVTPTAPQEDEIAIANMSPLSFYHGIYFPEKFDALIDRGLFFDDASPEDIDQWKEVFTLFLRKLYHQQRKPLLIKNPVYTARPALLKQMFPDAKFVHIHRDPFDVFLSMRNFYTKLLAVMALQPYDHVDIDATILRVYHRMMTMFSAQTKGCGSPDFVELSYADLDRDPMAALETVYSALELPGFDAAQPAFSAYLSTIQSYQKNAFQGDQSAVDKVVTHWQRWLDRWGYTAPTPRAS